MPKISVIVPVYNAEKYLSMTLNSILNQTFSDFELICVNDGSKDNSLAILNDFASKDKRVIVINQDNKGVSAARNNAVSKAVGEYIVFLDADDLMHPTFLEKMYQVIRLDGADVAYCDYENVPEDCNAVPNREYKNFDVKTYDRPLEKFMQKRIKPEVMIWNKIYKASYVKDTPFAIHLQVCEDKVFTYQLLSKIKKITYLKKPLIFYRLSNASITRSSFKISHIYNHIDAYRLMKTFFAGNTPLEVKIRKKNLRMMLRQMIHRVYKKAPEDVSLYWPDLSNWARFMQERKEFDLKDFNLYHRFLMHLFLKKRFSSLLFILKIFK